MISTQFNMLQTKPKMQVFKISHSFYAQEDATKNQTVTHKKKALWYSLIMIFFRSKALRVLLLFLFRFCHGCEFTRNASQELFTVHVLCLCHILHTSRSNPSRLFRDETRETKFQKQEYMFHDENCGEPWFDLPFAFLII